MGNCISGRSVHPPTASLVVLQEDSRSLIKEFPEPVKVAEILRERPGFFVCHADSMRFDEYVSPLSAQQELQMEHLYFMLPVAKLRRPLTASDMAALAVEASAAMGRNRRRRNKLSRRRDCKIRPSVTMTGQAVSETNQQERTSSSGEMKREGYDSETRECRKRVEVNLRARSVNYKLQRVASGRKRFNGGALRRMLSTIHEEAIPR